MKLHYAAQTRSTRPRWMLEELGQPYELVRVSLRDGEHKTPAHRKIHPHGAVPALETDDGTVIFESAAICLHLADAFPEAGLAPALGTADRAHYYQWIVYAMATAEPPILKVFLNTRLLPEEQRSPEIAEQGRTGFADVARVLEEALGSKDHLVGDRFSTADVLIGSIGGWARALGLLEGHPKLEAYVERMTNRPAYKRATAD